MLMAALGLVATRAVAASCDEALDACDLYVLSLEEERDQQTKLIEQQNERISKLTAEVNPIGWYWYALGGVAAAILVEEIR